MRAAPAARGPRGRLYKLAGVVARAASCARFTPSDPAHSPRVTRARTDPQPRDSAQVRKDSMLPGSPGPRGLGCSPAPPTSSARPGIAARWGINGRAGTSAPPTARAAPRDPQPLVPLGPRAHPRPPAGALGGWRLDVVPAKGGLEVPVPGSSASGVAPGTSFGPGTTTTSRPLPRPPPRARGPSSPNGEPLVGDLETRAPTPAPCPVPSHSSHLIAPRSRHSSQGGGRAAPVGSKVVGPELGSSRGRGTLGSGSRWGRRKGPPGVWVSGSRGGLSSHGSKLWSPRSRGSLRPSSGRVRR